jgi:hypothetical protein
MAADWLSKGTPVWVAGSDSDGEGPWQRGVVSAVPGASCVVSLDRGGQVTVPPASLAPANPAFLDLARCGACVLPSMRELAARAPRRATPPPPSCPCARASLHAPLVRTLIHCVSYNLAACSDLTNLSYLNEPGMLHTLRQRFAAGQIYTATGPVLVAINPFRPLPLYGPEEVQRYSQRSAAGAAAEGYEPHVFLTADQAYKQASWHSCSVAPAVACLFRPRAAVSTQRCAGCCSDAPDGRPFSPRAKPTARRRPAVPRRRWWRCSSPSLC